MGPVNWMVVSLAGVAAAAVLWLFWRGRLPVWSYGLALIPAAMLGHALARIGADKLAAKPWLYFMQSGGLALAFVLPAVWLLGLRSTGTSFCYNVGRFVAASGPAVLGLLTNVAYKHTATAADPSLPLRYAGITMCSVYLIGLIALPFAPETLGKPLPESQGTK